MYQREREREREREGGGGQVVMGNSHAVDS